MHAGRTFVFEDGRIESLTRIPGHSRAYIPQFELKYYAQIGSMKVKITSLAYSAEIITFWIAMTNSHVFGTIRKGSASISNERASALIYECA
jgi:hypothetical protein